MARKNEDFLDAYLDFTSHTEPCELFRLWSGISAVASALRRKCYLQWETRIYPNLYIVLIGPSGARKTTAMTPAKSLLLRVGARLSSDAASKEALIQQLVNSRETVMPTLDGVGDFSCSLTVFSKELSSFLNGEDFRFMSFLTDWYDCDDSWTYTTVSREEERIEGVWVNLIGATTPTTLRNILPMDAVGAGLSSRIIFVYGDSINRVPVPIMPDAYAENESRLVFDLESIQDMCGAFKPTPEFIRLYSNWYTDVDKHTPQFLNTEVFEPYCTRRPTHLRKLAMIFSASMSSDRVLDAIHFERALKTLEHTEQFMPNAFATYGRDELSEMFQRVSATIRENPGGLSYGEILAYFYKEVDENSLKRILKTLTVMQPPAIEVQEVDVGKGKKKQLFVWKQP